jgi:Uma2 family endonuclease
MGTTTMRATLADLAAIPGKAELIGGRIVHLMPTGLRPGQVGGRIYQSLDAHATATGNGLGLPDNIGFAVPELASGRESFSPDASFYDGPMPADEDDFVPGPPNLAVEVRSKGDHGIAAEAAMAAKRADYFEAGTRVVWDVDPKVRSIRSYNAGAPDHPTVFGPGDIAHAESAVPGWRLAVDELFG